MWIRPTPEQTLELEHTTSRPSMRRFQFKAQLQTAVLEAQLPAHAQRLVLTLNAPHNGRMTRDDATSLWRALREREHSSLKYHLALDAGPLETGTPACWLAITSVSNTPLLTAAQVFEVLLRQHVPLFADGHAGNSEHQMVLLQDLERRKGWQIILSGDLELLRERLKHVPPEVLGELPHVRLGRIFLMLKDVRLRDAEKEWRQFRRDLTNGRYPQFPAWEAGLMRDLVAGYAEAAVTQTRYAYLERLARQIPQREAGALGIVYNRLCRAANDAGDVPRALMAANAARDAYDKIHSSYGNLFIYYHRGVTLTVSGHVTEARRDFRKGLALSRQQLLATDELPSIGLALIAWLDYLQNRTDKAIVAIEAALAPIEQGESWSHLLWWVYRTWLELAASEYNPASLERGLRHARRVARERSFRRLETRLDLLEIEFDLRRNNRDIARRRARLMQLEALAKRPSEHDLGWRQTIFHARYLLLLLNLPQAGLHERQQAQWLALEGQRLQDFELRVRALLLCAQMDLNLGNEDAAFAAIDEVLSLLLPERPIRVLLDYPGIASLLADYRRAARHRRTAIRLQGWLDELERAARDDARLVRSHTHRVALTARELDILHELAHGRRNKEIAQRLKCSENTVKFYLKRLNGKFSTHKRAELLAQARDAGILD